MNKVIDQFMWAYQHTFRTIVEHEIQNALSHIGFQTYEKVKVLLIGLATLDNLPHGICIEPENGPLEVADLSSIAIRTEELVQADPESAIVITNQRIQEKRKHDLYLRSRAQAIAEAIQESRKFEDLKFFVSDSTLIAGYEVHTCLGIPITAIESVPCFNNPKKDEYFARQIEDSFSQALINTCLNLADKALNLPYPGEGLTGLGDGIEISRSSADRFVRGIALALTSNSADLFRHACDFTSLTYERSGARGHLVITNPDNMANKLKVTFRNTVKLHETRSIRKLLELTDDSMALISDGQDIYGIGECQSAPDVAKIKIDGHAKWSLIVDDTTVIKVSYGNATLPKQILDKDLFIAIGERTLGNFDSERIWSVFQCVLDTGYGTTIVVSKDPASEIERLGQETLAIKPEYLGGNDVARLGRIDGAIFLGPDGRCHAIGVILDGLATSSGDRARGARYNSSVRYQQTSEIGTLVIVVSEDGTVDLIPKMMPRVSRQDVEDAVNCFCDYSGIDGNDGAEWSTRNSRVEAFGFYLSEEQCDRVNEAYETEMDARLKSDGLKMLRERLKTNPDMDDSYFL